MSVSTPKASGGESLRRNRSMPHYLYSRDPHGKATDRFKAGLLVKFREKKQLDDRLYALSTGNISTGPVHGATSRKRRRPDESPAAVLSNAAATLRNRQATTEGVFSALGLPSALTKEQCEGALEVMLAYSGTVAPDVQTKEYLKQLLSVGGGGGSGSTEVMSDRVVSAIIKCMGGEVGPDTCITSEQLRVALVSALGEVGAAAVGNFLYLNYGSGAKTVAFWSKFIRLHCTEETQTIGSPKRTLRSFSPEQISALLDLIVAGGKYAVTPEHINSIVSQALAGGVPLLSKSDALALAKEAADAGVAAAREAVAEGGGIDVPSDENTLTLHAIQRLCGAVDDSCSSINDNGAWMSKVAVSYSRLIDRYSSVISEATPIEANSVAGNNSGSTAELPPEKARLLKLKTSLSEHLLANGKSARDLFMSAIALQSDGGDTTARASVSGTCTVEAFAAVLETLRTPLPNLARTVLDSLQSIASTTVEQSISNGSSGPEVAALLLSHCSAGRSNDSENVTSSSNTASGGSPSRSGRITRDELKRALEELGKMSAPQTSFMPDAHASPQRHQELAAQPAAVISEMASTALRSEAKEGGTSEYRVLRRLDDYVLRRKTRPADFAKELWSTIGIHLSLPASRQALSLAITSLEGADMELPSIHILHRIWPYVSSTTSAGGESHGGAGVSVAQFIAALDQFRKMRTELPPTFASGAINSVSPAGISAAANRLYTAAYEADDIQGYSPVVNSAAIARVMDVIGGTAPESPLPRKQNGGTHYPSTVSLSNGNEGSVGSIGGFGHEGSSAGGGPSLAQVAIGSTFGRASTGRVPQDHHLAAAETIAERKREKERREEGERHWKEWAAKKVQEEREKRRKEAAARGENQAEEDPEEERRRRADAEAAWAAWAARKDAARKQKLKELQQQQQEEASTSNQHTSVQRRRHKTAGSAVGSSNGHAHAGGSDAASVSHRSYASSQETRRNSSAGSHAGIVPRRVTGRELELALARVALSPYNSAGATPGGYVPAVQEGDRLMREFASDPSRPLPRVLVRRGEDLKRRLEKKIPPGAVHLGKDRPPVQDHASVPTIPSRRSGGSKNQGKKRPPARLAPLSKLTPPTGASSKGMKGGKKNVAELASTHTTHTNTPPKSTQLTTADSSDVGHGHHGINSPASYSGDFPSDPEGGEGSVGGGMEFPVQTEELFGTGRSNVDDSGAAGVMNGSWLPFGSQGLPVEAPYNEDDFDNDSDAAELINEDVNLWRGAGGGGTTNNSVGGDRSASRDSSSRNVGDDSSQGTRKKRR